MAGAAPDVDLRTVLTPVVSRADAHDLAKLQTLCRLPREARGSGQIQFQVEIRTL